MTSGGGRWVVTCVSIAMATTSIGCLERKGTAIGPNIGFGQEVSIDGGGVSAVDVLFVIDNSGSMSQEQSNLAVQIPRLVRELASPPDRDADGRPDWNPVEQLRIAITTTDVGIGASTIEDTGCTPDGDDGALVGGVFEWRTGDDPDAFAGRVRATVMGLGITGCGFEQPIEAAARAVEHADGTDFPGRDGLFAVIVVTDEEDCSVEDDAAFFSGAERGLYNVHCTRNREQLTPLDELADRIRGERAVEDFIFAAITGVPTDLASDATPEQILALPSMQLREVAHPILGLRVEPVCEFIDDAGMSLGLADPARRLVELAALVPDSVLTTICTDDFGPALSEIAARIGARVPGVCLVRELPSSGGAEVPCEIRVTLPTGMGCEAFPGYTLLEESAEGRAICDLAQVPGGEGSGFFYSPDHETCAQLVITPDALPPIGAEVHAECFFALLRPLDEACVRDSQCESAYCDRVTDLCAPYPEVPGETPPATGD